MIPSTATIGRATAIGAQQDFITAPEISQVFGELIGLWAAVVWQQMGSPARVRLVEVGPGRGTLMRDALRAARAVPRFHETIEVVLIEPNGGAASGATRDAGRHRQCYPLVRRSCRVRR